MKSPKKVQKNQQQDVKTPKISSKTSLLHVGIDLGTSRSAIASSNGSREVMASLVGWPKDSVSAKVLGGQTLVGDAVLKSPRSQHLFPAEGGQSGLHPSQWIRAGFVSPGWNTIALGTTQVV